MKTHFVRIILFAATLFPSAASLASTAHDDASQAAYADGWDDGDNGGVGFGPWSLSFDGDSSALNPIYNDDPHFIDGVGVGPLGANLLGAPAFGLTTDNSVSASTEATRAFAEPMKVGQTFRVDIDSSALEGSARIGNLFELIGTDGVPRYSLRTSLGSADNEWAQNGTPIVIDAGETLRVSIKLTGPDTFSGSVVSSSQNVGTMTLNSSLIGTPGVAIGSLRFLTSGTGSSTDGARELFFDNLELTRADIVPEPTGVSLAAIAAVAAACGRPRHDTSETLSCNHTRARRAQDECTLPIES